MVSTPRMDHAVGIQGKHKNQCKLAKLLNQKHKTMQVGKIN